MNQRSYFRSTIYIVIFTVCCCIVMMVSLCIGSIRVPITRIFDIWLNGPGSPEYSILFSIRMPRIILGFAIGGSLSLAGTILQGIFRNPLVEPYTLGISGGASLGVCLNIIFKLYESIGILAYPLSGFLGAFIVIICVYSFSLKRNTLNTQSMLLAGVMISFIASSLVMLLMAISTSEDLQNIVFWIMGSLEEPNSKLIFFTVFSSICGLLMSYLFCSDLNAFFIGEDDAFHLGIHVERTKRILFLVASGLTGFCVAVSGIIGFVGLIVPHFIRIVVTLDHRILLICSFLGGAIFLIICDTIARTVISPLELPVGVITGIIGGCAFILAMSKKQVRL